MPICEYLEKNAKIYPNEVALVEINPARSPHKSTTWREFSLIESAEDEKYRREMTWKEFDTKANRFANLLLTRGVKRGDKVRGGYVPRFLDSRGAFGEARDKDIVFG